MSEQSAEWARLMAALRVDGVAGVEDFGRFVNSSKYFAPSVFDERAAMPVLLEALPRLSDPKLVETVARHLGRRWARPFAFWPLHEAFVRFGRDAPLAAWAIGDSLTTVSTPDHADSMLALATDRRYGMSRQMIVLSLYRFKADSRVESVLRELVDDPEVSLQATSALQRVIGPEAMIPVLERLIQTEPGSTSAKNAAKRLRSIRMKLAKAAHH